MMKRRKGYALPTAILLCSFLLLVSISVGTILFANTANNRIANQRATYDLIFSKAHNQFINGQEITNTTFTWEIYEKDDDANVKALAAYSKADALWFYSIYDFTNHETLAYQTKTFYITEFGGNQYLGGIVRVKRGN